MGYPVFNNKMLQDRLADLKIGVKVSDEIIDDCKLNGVVQVDDGEYRFFSNLVYVRNESMPVGVYRVEMLSAQHDDLLEIAGLAKASTGREKDPPAFDVQALVQRLVNAFSFDKSNEGEDFAEQNSALNEAMAFLDKNPGK